MGGNWQYGVAVASNYVFAVLYSGSWRRVVAVNKRWGCCAGGNTNNKPAIAAEWATRYSRIQQRGRRGGWQATAYGGFPWHGPVVYKWNRSWYLGGLRP